jgi:hypothetical protein
VSAARHTTPIEFLAGRADNGEQHNQGRRAYRATTTRVQLSVRRMATSFPITARTHRGGDRPRGSQVFHRSRCWRLPRSPGGGAGAAADRGGHGLAAAGGGAWLASRAAGTNPNRASSRSRGRRLRHDVAVGVPGARMGFSPRDSSCPTGRRCRPSQQPSSAQARQPTGKAPGKLRPGRRPKGTAGGRLPGSWVFRLTRSGPALPR